MSDFTTTDLANINAAIAAGTTSVRMGDRWVTYASLDEMIRIRNMIRADLGLTGADGGSSFRYGGYSKGIL